MATFHRRPLLPDTYHSPIVIVYIDNRYRNIKIMLCPICLLLQIIKTKPLKRECILSRIRSELCLSSYE